MTDIVEWLKNQAEFERSNGEFARANKFDAAREEIERLQAALKEIIEYESGSDKHPVVAMARRALHQMCSSRG